MIEQADDLMRLIQYQANASERLCNDRIRANDVIRTIRGLGAEAALQAARDVFPRLRPSEVNDTDRLAEIIEALEAVLIDFSDVSSRTIEVAGSDTSGRPDTKQVNKTKTFTAAKQRNDQPLRTTPAPVALLATHDLRENMELYWNAQDEGRQLSWSSVLSAAWDRAQQLGVSGALWERQCDLFGTQRTALCLVVADRKAERTDEYRVRNVARAFVGMTRHEARKGGAVDSLLGELIAFEGGRLK